MKKIYALILILSLVCGGSTQGQTTASVTVKGRLCNEQGEKIDFATVALRPLRDTTHLTGAVTDDQGRFVLRVPRGDYHFQAMFLGFESVEQSLSLVDDKDMGDITLKSASVAIDRVEVRANMVRRESDRFVVDVANSPIAIGKTAIEMLKVSPGVWVKDETGISINGRGGTQVMINNRLLQLSGENLTNYLRNIKAEDIQKIEVIPYAGADFDANMTGGVIKITLKRQLNDGIQGSLGVNYNVKQMGGHWLFPTFNLDAKVNKLSISSSFNYSGYEATMYNTETTTYKNIPNELTSKGRVENNGYTLSERLGVVYEINKNHSVGLEGNFFQKRDRNNTYNHLRIEEPAGLTEVNSQFLNRGNSNNMSLSGNYIATLDTLGSSFRLLLDYNHMGEDSPADYFSAFTGVMMRDTTYDGHTNTAYDVATVTAHLDWVFNPTTTLKGGFKYTYNKMTSLIRYRYLQSDGWHLSDDQSSDNGYIENIGAVYLNFSTRFKNNMSLNAGLRGEYTHADPTSDKVGSITNQDYFSLFPTLNLSIPLNKEGSYSVIVGYGRKIQRPRFWDLNPYRIYLSEYSYQAGNPKLKPAFTDEYSLTWVLAQAYTFTMFYNNTHDGSGLVAVPDSHNPEVIIYQTINIPRTNTFGLAVNIPTQITPWWNLNANLMYGRQQNDAGGTLQKTWLGEGNLTNTFTITKGFYYELQFYGSTSFYLGNIHFKPMGGVNTSLKKTFAKNKFTASIYMGNVFGTAGKQRISVNDASFVRKGEVTNFYRDVGVSFVYNFKTGKSANFRKVESGANEEKSRM